MTASKKQAVGCCEGRATTVPRPSQLHVTTWTDRRQLSRLKEPVTP
jgi:hypothetical protein